VTEGGPVLGATAPRRGGGRGWCLSHGGNAHAHVEPNGAPHCAPIDASHRSPINRAGDKSHRLCFCRAQGRRVYRTPVPRFVPLLLAPSLARSLLSRRVLSGGRADVTRKTWSCRNIPPFASVSLSFSLSLFLMMRACDILPWICSCKILYLAFGVTD